MEFSCFRWICFLHGHHYHKEHCYDVQFVAEEKFLQRTGYDGHNNFGQASVKIADFLSQNCGYTFAAQSQGTYGFIGTVTLQFKGNYRWSSLLMRKVRGGSPGSSAVKDPISFAGVLF